MRPNYIHLEETLSTNTKLAEIATESSHGTVVYADRQTKGRGQRGNSWESSPYKNITMSVLLKKKNVAPSHQFELSEITALALVNVLNKYIDHVSIKWPNDIYYKDFKICGILIEHSLSGGEIDHTICGIGLNINQSEFVSDAPNPISLKMITGEDHSVKDILHELSEEILRLCDTLPDKAKEVHENFLGKLYRKDGFYSYCCKIHSVSVDGTHVLEPEEIFQATITDVQPNGMMLLTLPNGQQHFFAFKEVMFVI